VKSLVHRSWCFALLVIGARRVELSIGRRIGMGVFLFDSGEMRFAADRRRAVVILVIGAVGIGSLQTRSALLSGSVVVLSEIADQRHRAVILPGQG
jgi:hypothetical protein